MAGTVSDLIGNYHRMFSFPSTRLLTVENLLAAMAISLLLSFESLFINSNLLAFFICIISSQFLSAELTYQIAFDKTLLSRRRSLGLTLATTILMIPAFSVSLVALSLVRELGAVPYATIVLSASLQTYLRYFALYMYLQTSRLKALLMALSQPVFLFAAILFLGGQFLPLLVVIPLGVVVGELSVAVIKNSVSGLMKLDGLSLSRAFFAGWMGGQTEKLEAVLSTESESVDAQIDAFIFTKSQEGPLKAVFLVPRVHAGPFRNIGSSNLPALLSERVQHELRVPTFVFHGAVSHEMDLVHSNDCERVAESVLEALTSNTSDYAAEGVLVLRGEDRMAGGASFNGYGMVWVSLAPYLSEDLPSQLQIDAEKLGEEKAAFRVSLIDAHNCLSPNEPPEDVFISMKLQVEEVVNQLMTKRPRSIQLGVSSVETSGFSADEIAGLKGLAGFLRIGEQDLGILLFDSNNVTAQLQEFLDTELLKRTGFPVEIFTTDTHALVGIRAKKDYSPLGETTSRQTVLDRSIEALERAKSDAEPVMAFAVTIQVKNVAVLGESGIQVLGRAANVTASLARRLLPITITGCALASLIIILLLVH